MPAYQLLPDADVLVTGYTQQGGAGTPLFQFIDDPVYDPAVPTAGTDGIVTGNTGQLAKFGLTGFVLPTNEIITSVEVHVYGHVTQAADTNVASLRTVGGAATLASSAAINAVTDSWKNSGAVAVTGLGMDDIRGLELWLTPTLTVLQNAQTFAAYAMVNTQRIGPDAKKNFAITTVATAPSPATSGTSIVLAAGDGAKMPAVPFNAVVWPAPSAQPTTANAEVVRVTDRPGAADTFTISRTQESTSARTIVVGDQIAEADTAKMFTDTDVRLRTRWYASADFGFVGDLQTPFIDAVGGDGAMTSGSNILTCATTTPFLATDVNKRITVPGAGVASAQLTGVIGSVTSASTCTILTSVGGGALNASTTVASKSISFGTDNTAAITLMQNTINGATYPHPKISWEPSQTNRYGIPTCVSFNKQVVMEGVASQYSEDAGDQHKAGGTTLAWWGTGPATGGATAFSAMFTCVPTTGATKFPIAALRWKHIALECRNGDQNQAVKGLEMLSCHGFDLEDVMIIDALAVGLSLNVVAPGVATPAAGSLGAAKDVTRGIINGLKIRELDNTSSPNVPTLTPVTTTTAGAMAATASYAISGTPTLHPSGYVWMMSTFGYQVLVNYTSTTPASGVAVTAINGCTISPHDAIAAPQSVSGSNVVQATPTNGACVILDGDAGANACCSAFQMWQLSHGTTWGPAALDARNADSNQFYNLVINGGDATNDGVINRIRKAGVRFNGSGSGSQAARNNVVHGGSAGKGGVSAMALNQTGTALLVGPSGPNYWELYQLGNGEAVPVREALAQSATQAAMGAAFSWTPNGGVRVGDAAPPVFNQGSVSALALLRGSEIEMGPQGFQIGLSICWDIALSKAAVGTSILYQVRLGTTGTSTDGVIAAMTRTGTAVLDDGVEVIVGTATAVTPIGAATSVANFATEACITGRNKANTATGLNSVIGMGPITGTATLFNSQVSGNQIMTLWITPNAAHTILYTKATVLKAAGS